MRSSPESYVLELDLEEPRKRTEVLHRIAPPHAKTRLQGVNRAADNTAPISKQATPFVKWVGGKRSILPQLLTRIPRSFGQYFEPFVGGGAMFFGLQRTLKHAMLSDTNEALIQTYEVVRDDVELLIKKLKVHAEHHSKAYYYEIRSKHRLTSPLEIAARLLYLNKTCFNGLYRVNSKGEFNVPMGAYVNPGIVQEENLRACSNALRGVKIVHQSFDAISPKRGDFVYFDPPYHPVSSTANFTSYSHEGFDQYAQQYLRDVIVKLDAAGVYVMLSNSNTPLIRKLYQDKRFRTAIVDAPRHVNCKPGKRGAVQEVVITNYSGPEDTIS